MEQPSQSVKKTYYSKVAGSHYTFPDGFQIHFHHGRYNFDADNFPGDFVSAYKEHPFNGKPKWKVYYDELEYLVTSNNPLVFDQGHIPADLKLPPELDPTKNARSESEIQQQNAAMLARGNVRETGDINKPASGNVSDPNASTVDPALQAIVLGGSGGGMPTTGPGASKADQLRAAAAARTQQAVTQSVQNTNGMG